MRLVTFSFMVVSLLCLLAALNAAWLGRLVRGENRRKFYLCYALLTLLAAVAFTAIRFAGEIEWLSRISGAFYFGSFWVTLQLLLLFAWPVSALAGLVQKRWRGHGWPKAANSGTLSRRSFIAHAAVLPPVAMTGVNAMGLLDAELGAVLRRMDLAYADLPLALNGLKIAHMTDIHIGPYVAASDLDAMLSLLRRESPDLLAITGDSVDDMAMLPAVAKVLQSHVPAFPLGTWFCMGNHEYIRGPLAIRRMLENCGVNVLINRHERIPFHSGEFYLAGVDYPMGARMKIHPDDAANCLDQACQGMSAESFTVLLAHHPDFLPGAFARHIRLTLAGHTHGAQVGWGTHSALEFLYPYMRGVYQDGGNMGFVSSGAGHWLPFRLNCPPEVSLITLRKTKMA